MIYFVFPDGYKKDRQYNGQKIKKYKMTNNDLQNIAQKTKDRATRTPLKSRGELMCSGRDSSSCSKCGTCRVTLIANRCTTISKRVLGEGM